MNNLLLVFFIVLLGFGKTKCGYNVQKILEGKDGFHHCEGKVTPGKSIYWESIPLGFHQDGTELLIHNITRNRTGEYNCIEENVSTKQKRQLDSVYLDVVYPAKILAMTIRTSRLKANETFDMTATVEGNPPPDTTLTQVSSGNTKFISKESGVLEITFVVTCDDRDGYILTSSNEIDVDRQTFNLTVLCAPVPDPAYPYNLTVTPRLGDSIVLEAHVKAFPSPTFLWMQADKVLESHTDTNVSSALIISPVHIENYAAVTLTMWNEIGESKINYNIVAAGPPDPARNFEVRSLTSSSAVLRWTTGFDYKSTQTFIVVNFENGLGSEIQSFPDDPNDNGDRDREETLQNLEPIKQYNISIKARNDRGNSPYTPAASFVTLGAPKPSSSPIDTFSPRVGESIVLQIASIAYPPPAFAWTLNNLPVDHHDSEQSSIAQSSAVYLNNIKPDEFGDYLLTIQNSVGEYTHRFGVVANGPPEPVTNFEVRSFTDNSALLTWTTGFDYNSTQMFVVVNYEQGVAYEIQSFPDTPADLGEIVKTETLTNLQPMTQYNITIIARNSHGDSSSTPTPSSFITLGAPEPLFPPQVKFSPRIGDNIELKIASIGNPQPVYFWIFNNQPVDHKDAGQTSTVNLNEIEPGDFGNYLFIMNNSIGEYKHTFEVNAEGPPEPVRNFQIESFTTNAANLSWTTGFDYNSTQTFVVMNYEKGIPTEMRVFADTPNDPGDISREGTLLNLNPNTEYNITIVAKNDWGEASGTPAPNSFVTLGAPRPSIEPDDKFAPRVGDNIALHISSDANPPPTFAWTFKGQPIDHEDTVQSSTVYLSGIKSENFGIYQLTMTNLVGQYTQLFFVNAEGPPDPVTNLKVVNCTTNSAILTWTTGFDYNSTQTFVVVNYENGVAREMQSFPDIPNDTGNIVKEVTLLNLESIKEYYITVIARNKQGNASHTPTSVSFETYGSPRPSKPPTDTFSPRLGDNIVLQISSLSNPPPTFTWTLNDIQIGHQDTEQSSTVHLNKIQSNDFGNYMLTMKNVVGEYTHQFAVNAEGPPEPVTNFQVKSFTSNSAILDWTTGFDYNSRQTFVVVNYENGVQNEIQSFQDTQNDPGNREKQEQLVNLQPLNQYNITIIARNSRGDAVGTPRSSSFFTLGAPKPAFPPQDQLLPRIGENIELQILSVANPPPTFTWTFHDNSINHQDTDHSSTVYLIGIKPEDFGNYLLVMKNSLGEYKHQFAVNADGPPDVATGLEAGLVSADSAVLSWFPGFDYGDVQTFTIVDDSGDLATVKGKLGDMEKMNYTVLQLTPGTAYSVKVRSSNSRGNASTLSNVVQFTTSKTSNQVHSSRSSFDGASLVGGTVLGAVIYSILLLSYRMYKARSNQSTESTENQRSDFAY